MSVAARLLSILFGIGLSFAGIAATPVASPAPLHGGVVAQVQDLECELVVSDTHLRLYVRGKGRPANLATSRAQLTLRSGPDQQEVALVPAGDRFEALGQFQVGPGTVAVAEIAAKDRPAVAVRFVLP